MFAGWVKGWRKVHKKVMQVLMAGRVMLSVCFVSKGLEKVHKKGDA